MKWILCGKNDAAVQALEHLVAQGDEVWAIATHSDDGEDSWQPSYAGAAKRHGVPLDQPKRINDPAFVERLASYGADALVSIQYDQILKGPLFDSIGCACLNLHFALLPRHRGVAPMAWAILEGDAEAGVTLHHMVVDIDAGDVLAQRAVPIGPETTARDLYDAVCGAAAGLFRDSYPFPAELLASRLPQDASRACYHRQGDLDFSKSVVDWDRPAAELHLWLRAMIFPPFQFPQTSCAGETLSIQRIAGSLEAKVGEIPGTVLESGAQGCLVAARDGAIRITQLARESGPADDLTVGARLSSQ